MATHTATATKRCPGFEGIEQAPHDLPADLKNFNSNRGSKDGLSTRCRICGNAYGKAWAARKRAIERAEALPLPEKGEAPGMAAQLRAERDLAIERASAAVAEYAKGSTAPEVPEKLAKGRAKVAAGLAGILAGTTTSDEVVASLRAEQHLTHPDGTEVFTGRADQVAERDAARQAPQGWTTEVVGGTTYAVPTAPEQVATEEGQQALSAVNAAIAAERRRRDAERKRGERAAAKARGPKKEGVRA